MGELVGVLLAAGAGTRLGMPGGLMRAADGTPWVISTVGVLRAAGCGPIGVVVGAAAPDVVALLAGEDVTIVPSPDWSDGLSRSVRAGFSWAEQTGAPAALFHMVDRPEVSPAVVRRVIAGAQHANPLGGNPATTGAGPEVSPDLATTGVPQGPATAVARAGYNGRPGYPVLIGRDHWAGAAAAATGDRSMGPYLKRVPCPLIPCDDLLG
ncbi:nucleotidyltransferase family protein [Kribbella sp. CA-253562]|uniref:nucleotidyltransferase family protein n=1 Tax=Kribbella sp. CA-253562 TaxID=3239942 RepID=UPI003D905CE7